MVLNLSIEYVPSVISEGSTLSLLPAAILNVALEGVILGKDNILGRLRAVTTRHVKIAAALSLWAVAAEEAVVRLTARDVA